ncbi:unnamed protein product [Paramecium pentaurelia]|uniref:G domain-containing protein n=1 Tax=Paramecium pentaurelia TaxID=43138 RepID=A0A8S1VVS3_9CILI|nr:unnamed protein product [Paramecium pentaurelia]
MQNQFNEQELLYIIKNYSKLLSLFEDHNQKQTQVIILIGVTGAGKSTLFNFLSGAEFDMIGKENQQFLNIKDGAQQFAAIKGGMKSITKSPNYYFSEMYNALLIDFPGFQDTDGKIDQVLIQLLFYQICRSANVKIVYVVKHPETRFNNRGTQIQDFIRQTFQGQNLEMSQICLMLNCYNDKLSDDNLIQNVQGQLEQIYRCRPQNICVMRKIKKHQDIQQHFTIQKRDFLFQQFLKSNSVFIFPQYIPQSELISQYLSEKSEKILEQLSSTLEKSLDNQIENLNYELIKKVENSLKEISITINNQQKDMVQWFLELINLLIRSNELLNSENTTNLSYQNFLTIFNFFASFSEFISGFEDIRHNGIIAQEKCEIIIKIVQTKIDVLVKQRELLEEEEQKRIEAQERRRAEKNRQLEAQQAQQALQNFQKQSVLHCDIQNNLNKEIKETFEVKFLNQELIHKHQQLEYDNQRQKENKLNELRKIQQSTQISQSQLNLIDDEQGISQKKIDDLTKSCQEIQKKNNSEHEKKSFNQRNYSY